MKKKVLALLLTVCMLAGLSACAGQDAPAGSGPASAGSQTPSDSSAAAPAEAEDSGNPEEGDPSQAYDFSDREHVTLKMYMFGDADTEQCEAVAAELSKITNERLNCDVELTRIGFGSYTTQVNLILSSGEQIDLFVPFNMALATLANSGQIQPITELLAQYAPQMYGEISEADWMCGSVGEDIYAVPPNKDKAMDLGFMMRKDVLDELGEKAEDIQSFDDLHDLLVKVKEAHPEMYPVVPDFGNTFGYLAVDNLGDHYGVLMDPYHSDSLKVENLFASDYYMELCTRMYSWAQEGLLMPDASSNTESCNNLIKSGKAFGSFSHMKVGFESEKSNLIGTEIVTWRYTEPLSLTAKLSPPWCVGETSVDPERAIALLNMMYTEPEVANLLINGIEGVHYDFVDKEKGIIKYPEGKDAASVGYARLPWGWPNEQISYLWEGDPETLWTDLNDFNENAIQSPAKGFAFDNSAVLNEVTACGNVFSKYHPALIGGQLDPAVTIPEFLKEMERAGLDTIIAEKQRQLDEWAANNQ